MTKLPVSAAALAAAAALASTAASAQADVEAVERCRARPTDAERFACLEDHVLGAEAAAPTAEPPAPPLESVAPAAEPVSAPAAPPAPPRADSAAAPAEPPRRRGLLPSLRLPLVGGGEDDTRAAAVVDGDAAGADALGAEQVAARAGEGGRAPETRYAFTIVSVGESYFGGLEVELDNGQVWRQQRDDGQRIVLREDDPMDVEIWRSDRFGGYRMRLVEQERTLRVQRMR